MVERRWWLPLMMRVLSIDKLFLQQKRVGRDMQKMKIGSTNLGGLALVIGGILTFIGNLTHPRAGAVLGGSTIDSEARLIQDNINIWYPSHTALILFPPLAVLGFSALYRILKEKEERVYSIPSLLSVSLAAILLIVTLVLDGYVSPLLAQDYLAATGAAKDTASAILGYNFRVSLSLLGAGFFTYTVSITLLGASLVKAKLYNKWLGYTGLIVGLVGVLGYVGGLFGPYWVLSVAFTPYAIILNVWIIATGGFLYRGR